jgi:magnesium-transporting ATPase (P-type)
MRKSKVLSNLSFITLIRSIIAVLLFVQQISPSYVAVSQDVLDSFNVEQARSENRARLIEIGGLDLLCKALGVSLDRGLSATQVETMRIQFGDNTFPDSPMSNFSALLFDAFSDATLLVLLAAAAVSLGIGVVDDPQYGWIEGTAIFIAVFLVANISAANDYTKELQFRALEQSAQLDERASVLRDGVIERINPVEIVVGDILVVQVNGWDLIIMLWITLLIGSGWRCNYGGRSGSQRRFN